MTPLHRPAPAPVTLFGGLEFRILLAAADTGGAFGQFLDVSQPGMGPPLHVHHDAAEAFAVIEGRYAFWCEGTRFEAGAGDALLIPRGQWHTFRNTGTGTGRLLVTMTPGGFEGFFPALAAAGAPAPTTEAFSALAERFHIAFSGPNPLDMGA